MVDKKKTKGLLYGLGLDHKDKHIRMTKGPNFILMGGSEPTHEKMQETAIKINEKLKKHGKTLKSVSEKEFFAIGEELGLKRWAEGPEGSPRGEKQ
jgi:predicted Zn-dependent peptidase